MTTPLTVNTLKQKVGGLKLTIKTCIIRYIYSKSGECIDVDECAESIHDCNGNAVCQNTVGSFECECKDGFSHQDTRIGTTKCRNVNECEIDTHDCGENSKCRDTIGAYKCICDAGFLHSVTGNYQMLKNIINQD